MYRKQDQATGKKIVAENFVGKYLVPTDNFSHLLKNSLQNYIRKMRDGKTVCTIVVATEDGTIPKGYEWTLVPVSEVEKLPFPVYILDGHHRYYAHLICPDYTLNAVFLNCTPDTTVAEIADLISSYLEGYEATKNLKGDI